MLPLVKGMPTGKLCPLTVHSLRDFCAKLKKFCFRVARALLIEKPILLEGAPGSGKSSLIVALAAATGHPLTRLNLSDQTVIIS